MCVCMLLAIFIVKHNKHTGRQRENTWSYFMSGFIPDGALKLAV